MMLTSLRRLAPPARPAALALRIVTAAVSMVASIALTVVSWSASTEQARGTGLVVGVVGTLLLLTELVWLSGALPVAMLASSATIAPALADRPGHWRALPVVVMLLLTELETAGWSRQLQSIAAPSIDLAAARLLSMVAVIAAGGGLSYGLLALTSLPSPSGLLAEAMAVGGVVVLAAVIGSTRRRDDEVPGP
jgi:hypothetical protein